MSLLISKSGEMILLKNAGFSESSAQWIIGKLSMLQDEIVEYVNLKNLNFPYACRGEPYAKQTDSLRLSSLLL